MKRSRASLNQKKPLFESCLLGFILGCLVTSTVFVFKKSHDFDFWLDSLAVEPTVNAKIDSIRRVVIKNPLHAVDCKFHEAENDPNELMEEDPAKFIEKIEPNFWISLHKKQFDRIRWNSIMQNGMYYERQITNHFKEILSNKPKGLVVDVGMNIGWYTLFSRAMGHTVVAFDPNPIMHSRVCNSLKLNQLWDGISEDSSATSGVTTFAYGLGDEPSTLNFTIAGNPGASSFIADGVVRKRGTLKVPVTTLDIAAAEMGWIQHDDNADSSKNIIHLLKIDCEGYEPYILRGASKLLNSGQVHNILFESSPGKRTELVLEMFTTLYSAGYFVAHSSIKNADAIDQLNQHLQDGTLEGSDMHTYFSETKCDMWWKRRS